MATIVDGSIIDGEYTFEIVESIPAGYKIWCYPIEPLDGYLPLYQDHPSEENKVNKKTLIAIKTDGVMKLHAAAYYGGNTKREIQNKINKLQKDRKTIYDLVRLEVLEKALVYAESLIWL